MINHTITETPADSWRLVFLANLIRRNPGLIHLLCARSCSVQCPDRKYRFFRPSSFSWRYKRFSPLPAPHYSLRFRSLFCCPLTKPVGKASAYRLAEKYPSSGNCLPLYCRTPPLLFKPPGKHPRLLFLWSAGPLFHQIE